MCMKKGIKPFQKDSESESFIFRTLCCLCSLDAISWSIAYPTYVSIQQELGMSLQDGQWLTSSLCCITFISTPVIGYISGHTSRRTCLMFASVVS